MKGMKGMTKYLVWGVIGRDKLVSKIIIVEQGYSLLMSKQD